jgi:hypothetical protein
VGERGRGKRGKGGGMGEGGEGEMSVSVTCSVLSGGVWQELDMEQCPIGPVYSNKPFHTLRNNLLM